MMLALDKGGRCLFSWLNMMTCFSSILHGASGTDSVSQDGKKNLDVLNVNYLAWADRTPVNLVTEKREESSDTGASATTLW